MDCSQKVKPKHLNRHLVAGCSIGCKSCLLNVNGWDMDQSKKSYYLSNKYVCVILGSCYHTDVFPSITFLVTLPPPPPQWFDAIKTVWKVLIDRWDCLQDIWALSLDSGRTTTNLSFHYWIYMKQDNRRTGLVLLVVLTSGCLPHSHLHIDYYYYYY